MWKAEQDVRRRPRYFLVMAVIMVVLSAAVYSRGGEPVGRKLGLPGWLLGSVLLAGGLVVGVLAIRTLREQRR